MTSKIADAGARRAAAKLRWLYGMPEREDATIFAGDVLLSQSGLGRAVEALTQILGWREIGNADTPREKLAAIEDIAREALTLIEHGHD